MQGFYQQSNEFLGHLIEQTLDEKANQPLQPMLLQYILNNSQKGNPADVISKIDNFCMKYRMMNIGPEKAKIVISKGFNQDVKKVLQIGGYCGYSALVFANQIKDKQNPKVYTIEINKQFAQIAHKIHQHAGLENIIEIVVADVEGSTNFIKQQGPFDLIFIDHIKWLYLSDFKIIQAGGGIRKGTVVIGDNIIYPGAPEYLQYFQKSQQYDSTLFHAYLEYTNRPDAVLISIKR